ncbi:MAG: hypothetical protein HUJ31_00230, partial [Pseudomonadales bacterium]|nr:hypothetical protein [Pseudomonadales bacterium]
MNAPSETQEPTEDVEQILTENTLLREENQQLKDRVAWFERQVFGRKSEKRLIDNTEQGRLPCSGLSMSRFSDLRPH